MFRVTACFLLFITAVCAALLAPTGDAQAAYCEDQQALTVTGEVKENWLHIDTIYVENESPCQVEALTMDALRNADGSYPAWLEACKAGSRFTAHGKVDAGTFAGTFSIGMNVAEFRCE